MYTHVMHNNPPPPPSSQAEHLAETRALSGEAAAAQAALEGRLSETEAAMAELQVRSGPSILHHTV